LDWAKRASRWKNLEFAGFKEGSREGNFLKAWLKFNLIEFNKKTT